MKNHINKIRKEKKMTIRQLSFLTNLTESTIYRIIRGVFPRKSTVIKLCKALGKRMEELFYF